MRLNLALVLMLYITVAHAAGVTRSPTKNSHHFPMTVAGVTLPADTLQVPLVRQNTDYSCGAAALLSVLFYWKAYDGTEESLYQSLGTTQKDGTEPGPMARVAIEHGLIADIRRGMTVQDLRKHLSEGTTVILDIQAWSDDPVTDWKNEWNSGHYVVLTGMDAAHAYFMDPSNPALYTYLPIPELVERWHDVELQGGAIKQVHYLGIVIRGNQGAIDPKSVVRIE